MTALSKGALATEVADFLEKVVGDTCERAQLETMGGLFAEYLTQAVSGATGGVSAIMWLLFSAAYEGKLEQSEIDEFFTSVNLDPAKAFQAWRRLKAENPGTYSFVLIPGTLEEGDIGLLSAALYAQTRPEA